MTPLPSVPATQTASPSSVDLDIEATEKLTSRLTLSSNNTSEASSDISEMSTGKTFQSANECHEHMSGAIYSNDQSPFHGRQLYPATNQTPIHGGSIWRSDPVEGPQSIARMMAKSFATPVRPSSGQYSNTSNPIPIYGGTGSGKRRTRFAIDATSPTNYGSSPMSIGSPPTPITNQFGYVVDPYTSSYPSRDTSSLLGRPQIHISESLLDNRYSYALKREDGTFTRLIPADQLPKMKALPEYQGPEGLIILPKPRAMSPRAVGRGTPTVS
jgi:hypothetical protein